MAYRLFMIPDHLSFASFDLSSSAYSCVSSSTQQSVPGYGGRFSWYFFAKSGGTKRPPKKCCLPLKSLAQSLGAVREIRLSGCMPSGSPFSMSQPARYNTNTRTGTNANTITSPALLIQQQQLLLLLIVPLYCYVYFQYYFCCYYYYG